MAITIPVGGGGSVVRKSQVINSSQTWTAPAALAGNTIWVTGCAAGGSGAAQQWNSNFFATGGWGGSYCVKAPLAATPSQAFTVVIGAGGLGVSSGANGNQGGNSSFGSLVLQGGSGGRRTTSVSEVPIDAIYGTGIRPNLVLSAKFIESAESINGNRSGASGATTDRAFTGGACGYFGNGTDSNTTSTSAASNTGAGSGAGAGTASGAGGSGKFIVEWEEFV